MGAVDRCLCIAAACLFSFFFGLAEAGEIQFFSPQGEIKKVRQVAVRFSGQMVAFGDPREVDPFNIDCLFPGKGRWADQRNWVYDFDQDLPAGFTCSFRTKKGLTTLDGEPIEGGEKYSFNTGGPAILQSEPYQGSYYIDENQIFILGLDAPAAPVSIQKSVYCQADGILERIPVEVITGKMRASILSSRDSFLTRYYLAIFKRGSHQEGRIIFGIDEKGSDRERFLKLRDSALSPIVVLKCKRTFPNNATVSLVWGKGVASIAGITTSQDQGLSFHTRQLFEAKFSCERVNAESACIPSLPMQLSFTAPLAVEKAGGIRLVAESGKTFQPVLTKEDKKQGFVQLLTFPAPLPDNATFRIVLPKSVTDDAGRTLSNASSFPLEVSTDEYPPLAKFSANFGILESNAGDTPLLPVTLRNVESELPASRSYTALSGKTLHASSEADVISWLRKLQNIDSNYDPLTQKWDSNRGPGKTSIFADNYNGSAESFVLPKPLGDKAFEVVGIPLREPGFYVVELASPRLGEALLGEARPYYVQAAALVTNLAVHFKEGRESSLVWVTSLDRGKPVSDAEVAIRDCRGNTYFEGRTDAQGILKIDQELPMSAKLPSCLDNYDRQYFVTARFGGDFSFVLSNWNEGIALWRFNAFQGSRVTQDIHHAVMDRTLFRAGETAHVKLLARRKTSAGFSDPGTLPSTVTIVHQGSNEKFQVSVSRDRRGTAEFDWSIPPDAKQGTYLIQTPQTSGSFRVESFRVPTMKALLQPAQSMLVNASQAKVNIQVNYLSGGGASFLPVKLRGQLKQKYVRFTDYQDFTFANGGVKLGLQQTARQPWSIGGYELSDVDEASVTTAQGHAMLASQSLRLDAAGSGQGEFSGLPGSDLPREIEAELEYQDPNGETLSASARIPLWPGKSLVGIKPEGWMATSEHLKFKALVVDLNGKPRVGEQVVVKAMQREYFSHRRRLIGGFYAFDNHSEINLIGELCKGRTDEHGMLACDVSAPARGNIILQAESRDEDGNASVANREVWVAGDDDWWFDASDNDRIDLLPEKKRYEPGDKAQFQLRMPFQEADVLVTIEREGVMESIVTHLTRANPTIEVPIKGNYAPNVFVSALAIRGRVNDAQPTALVDLGKPAFKMGLAEINVGWSKHELKVKVATDKQVYRVRDKAKVSIDVRRSDGSMPPPGSEVALIAVDEGLLELKPNDSWELLEAMMRRRGIEVSTSTAQMQVIGKRHFGRKALEAGGGGGVAKSARELFDSLLFWRARVKLDEKGHAEEEVTLNDSLTSFRIVAVADADMDLFGTGSTSIQSTQDLMLFSGLPPVVREQDRFRATFNVRNASERPIEAVVSASLNFAPDPAATRLSPVEIRLQPGESRNIGWDVLAALDRDAIRWDVSIREKGVTEKGDHLKTVQKIIAAVPVRTLQATLLQLEAPQSINVKLPEGAIPGRGGVKVTFRKKLGDGLDGVTEYMSRYPYTCLEQLASQAVALRDRARWDALMKRLPTYLDRDGLVKYFPVMLEGDDTLTAYLLSIADESGYAIPEDMRSRMREGLIGFVEGRVIRYSALPTSDLAIRKLAAIEALTRVGSVESRWLDSITIEPNLWPTSAVLDWASILQRSPGISPESGRKAENARQIIRSRLNFQGTTMGFSTERSDTLWWLMINGDVNANRALLVLLDRQDWAPDIPRLVRGTLGRQQAGRWNTTVANAWGVLAMQKFSASFEKQPVTGKSTARLGEAYFPAEWNDETTQAQQLLPWPASIAAVNLSHDGSGKPWTMLQSLAALPLKEPLFTGYRVTRSVTPVSQQAKGEWHKGDVARIHLEVEAQSDMAWVVVNDPVPSGASILGTGLGGDSSLLRQGEKKQGWVWPAFEERTFDSFRAYYRFVPKGKFSVEYTVRLNNDGEFRLPPTHVEAMYAPEMFGDLPNSKVVVRP